jgi:hypothetical protein
MMAFFSLVSLVITVVLICIFIGMFMRLGRIEQVLRQMAIHQGAIPKVNEPEHDVLHDVYGTK